MLLTRYAPLRRSPASEPEDSDPLPLDLHVLSLPLAFILSQDQTLRCICISFSIFSLSRVRPPRLSADGSRPVSWYYACPIM